MTKRLVCGSETSSKMLPSRDSGKNLPRKNTPEIKFNRLVFNDSIDNMDSRKVNRLRRPSLAPVRPVRQPRNILSCFWSCSRPSAASNEAVIDPRPPPLHQLKAAIDSEQCDQIFAAME